jgi:hypothetical protein
MSALPFSLTHSPTHPPNAAACMVASHHIQPRPCVSPPCPPLPPRPQRTTLMTGYHSGHFTALGLDGEALGPDWSVSPLLPELMRSAGYATAGIGKLAPLTNPTEQGFDYFVGQIDQALCHNMCVSPRVVRALGRHAPPTRGSAIGVSHFLQVYALGV